TKLLTDGSLRERIGSIAVGDVAQHPRLVHGLEAFNRVSERLLEFKDDRTRSGVPRQSLPRLLGQGGARRAEEHRTGASKEHATVYQWACGNRVGSMQEPSSRAGLESSRRPRGPIG